MKLNLFTLIFLFLTFFSFGQSKSNNSPNSVISTDNNITYRLFPTSNMWNFIKLNTRDGRMWQVQYSLDNKEMKYPLSLTKRVLEDEESNGRFFLYPTQNMWTFILLDQIDGRVWQVQWSLDDEKRFVIPIY